MAVPRASWKSRILGLVGSAWYMPMVAGLAFSDLFLCVVPVEVFLVAGVLARPRVWLWGGLLVSAGSSLGAFSLSLLVQGSGRAFLEHTFPKLFETAGWGRTVAFLGDHGQWAISAIAASPLPQQPAVVMAALSGVSPFTVLGAVLGGRAVKYLLFAWLAAYMPDWVRRRAP